MISEALIDIEIDHADQTEESDMSFLTRMAETCGDLRWHGLSQPMAAPCRMH
jgi:hypothetical protein